MELRCACHAGKSIRYTTCPAAQGTKDRGRSAPYSEIVLRNTSSSDERTAGIALVATAGLAAQHDPSVMWAAVPSCVVGICLVCRGINRFVMSHS